MKAVNKSILFLLLLCVVLAGCGAPAASEESGTQNLDTSVGAPSPEETEAVENDQTAVLYIGTRDAGFAEYPVTCKGGLTPEMLIAGIAELTNWDLTLAEPVTVGKGGMSVCLSEKAALFTGPPDPQKEEFHMFDAEQMAQTVLDSIQKTLQMGFVGEGGDPDALDIYYYMEGDKPLELPVLGMSWSLEQPYQWEKGCNFLLFT